MIAGWGEDKWVGGEASIEADADLGGAQRKDRHRSKPRRQNRATHGAPFMQGTGTSLNIEQ
jgi:hypothetical protein